MISVYYGTEAQSAVKALVKAHNPFAELGRHSKVVIKPNIVVAKREWLGADTRPEAVEAVVREMQRCGVQDITIADGSGVGHTAGKAFGLLGYESLADRCGVRLLDIEQDRFVERKTACSGPFEKLRISRTVAECDYLVNMPVLKAHGETKLTCSLKNLKGVMPREMKPRFHSVDLHQAIAQLNSVVSPDFTVVDGAYGDLSSEMGGNPIEIGMMIAGSDLLEIDVFAATVLGFQPEEILHLAGFARYRGVDVDRFIPQLQRLNQPAEQKRFSVSTDPFKQFPCEVSGEGVCCTCRGNLVFALRRLKERGKLSRQQHFLIGRRADTKAAKTDGGKIIAVGNCAIRGWEEDPGSTNHLNHISIQGCPPEAAEIVNGLTENL